MDNNRIVPVLVGIIMLLVGIGGAIMFGSDEPAREFGVGPDAAEIRLGKLEDQMGQISSQISSLSGQIAANQSMQNAAGSIRRETTQQQIDRMVAAAVAKQLQGQTLIPSSAEESAEQEEAARQLTLDAALAKFLDPTLSFGDHEVMWDELKEAGLLEEAIEMLEDLAAADPDNEGLQVQLGYGYLQPIIRGNVAGMEAGQWSMKADATFDRVLEANPENWDARFSKAVSYSFWPPMFGKQKDAIDNFEILIGQQANQPADPKFAQTHLLLGNLYSQAGQDDKAQEAWASGFAQYPEDPALREKMGLE
jgi:tetratricopeptide (TPR) repeat protein